MANRFTPKAQEALEATRGEAERLGHTYIGTEHLLLGISATECVGSQILRDKGASYEKILDHVVDFSGAGDECFLDTSFTPRCKRALESALSFAKRSGSKFIGTEHLLFALCADIECVASRILCSLGISTQGLKNEISSLAEAISKLNSKSGDDLPSSSGLSAYGKCLNSVSSLSKADPLIGREADIMRLIQILCRKTKNNPCLIGEPGVGKTAIVEGLARMISEGRVPVELQDKLIIALDMPSMIAGTKYRGEFEERMRAVLNEVKENDKIILFIDEIHTIIGAGGAEGAIDAANIIKPSLSRGDLRVIGATTTEEYRRYIEKDSALERRFQPVLIQEPSEDEAIVILKGLKSKYEAHHGVKISDEAITSAVKLSTRYITDRFLPDKAIDLLDEACSSVRIRAISDSDTISSIRKRLDICKNEKEDAIIYGDYELASALRDEEAELIIELARERERIAKEGVSTLPCVSEKDICDIITLQTKIPIRHSEHESALKDLQKNLEKAIIGQKNAVESVAYAIKRGRLGIKNPNRPCASLLFLGPTGVGKTELAKQLAKYVFGTKDALVRLDMSEYSERHSISKLIGSPAGYVGYEDEGRLGRAVRRRPYCVVLFDEIEKAHPDIYSLLLQILEDGVITDAQGKRISFKNAIIILTSNIGAQRASGVNLGFDMNSGDGSVRGEQMLGELKRSFSPELLNRLDEIIAFKSISQDDAKGICRLMLSELSERLEENGIKISFSEALLEHILRVGYSEEYGARNLRRAITVHIENSLCEELLKGKIEQNRPIIADFNGKAIFYEYVNI